MNFKGKSILITGASSGIGKALTKEFAAQECTIFLASRRKNLLDEIKKELSAVNSNILTYECDVINKQSIAETFAKIKDKTDFIDLAILNAGFGHNMKIENFDSKYAEQIFGVNVLGMIYWIEKLLPDFLKMKKGIIAGVSSLADNRGFSESGFYCASKAAATIYLDGLRVELKRHGVKVITVKPGFVKTPMTDKNDFRMPLIMPAEKAAKIIVKGLIKEKSIIQFPLPLVLGSKFVGALPTFFYERIAGLLK
jgi:short-subunit dehydrogenase